MCFCPLTDNIGENRALGERDQNTGERGENHGQSRKEYRTGRIGGWRGLQVPGTGGKEIRMGVEEGLFGGVGGLGEVVPKGLAFPPGIRRKVPYRGRRMTAGKSS